MTKVKASLTGSILNQKNEVESDFNSMWDEMMKEFKDLSNQMRDDMNTYR